MQGTRWQLLTVLKRKNGATVDELAQALGLAPVSVRQQLLVLQRDSYVTAQEVRGATGRPHHRYFVTPVGDDLFPKAYHSLLESLLKELPELEAEELKGLDGDDKARLILRKVADRELAQQLPALAAKNLPGRVAAVSCFLQETGTLSEWEETEDGFRIMGYNCPYQRVAQDTELLCFFHTYLVGELLRATVVKELTIVDGDGKCSFLIWPNGNS